MQCNIVVEAAARLSDADLLCRVGELACRERRATVELIAHLAELDRRKLYREQGYGSLFSYCTESLHLSEHATFNRIEAARASRRFPLILELLANGALNLSTVRLLAPHLTEENHQALLAEVRCRSKREVEAIVARIAPQPDVPPSIRRVPAPAPPASPAANGGPVFASVAASVSEQEADLGMPVVLQPSTHRAVVKALSPERYRIQFTVTREAQEKLRRVQDLLRREIPDGDPGRIFERALTLLLEDVARRKLAATPSQRPTRTGPRSRRIPAEVRRKVWAPRPRPVRVRLAPRAPLPRASLPGVPPRGALCRRRRDDGNQHLPPVPGAQCPRG
jgi:hypothetical protein